MCLCSCADCDVSDWIKTYHVDTCSMKCSEKWCRVLEKVYILFVGKNNIALFSFL